MEIVLESDRDGSFHRERYCDERHGVRDTGAETIC